MAADGAAEPTGVPLNWQEPRLIRDDGVDRDLGYPVSLELEDRSMLTISYGRLAPGDARCSLLWARWQISE
jgi:hypothetical protein